MKNSVAFPYPVLGRSDDYSEVEFQVAMREPQISDEHDHSKISIDYVFDLSDESLVELVEQKKAKFGFEIVCKNTSIRYVEFANEAGTVEIPLEKVHGRVEILPYLLATDFVANFKSDNFNNEFGDASFDISPGDILAEGDADAINVEFGTLTFESLLKVIKVSRIEPHSYDFSLDGNTIQIAMGEKLFEAWGFLKERTEMRPFLIMSIYKDCIVAALERLIEQKDTDLKWANSLLRVLEKKEIELPAEANFSDLNLLAQKVLQEKGVKRITNAKT